MYALKPYIAARAQLVTFILFIWELYCIERFIENKKIRYAITLVIISTLIANLHVATWPFFFILFLPYIAEYIISVVSDIVIYKKTKKLVIKHKMKVAQKNNNIERIKELQIKLNELEEKNEKIKQKRKDTNKNSYKILLNKNDNVKFLIIVMVICAFTGLITPTGDTPYTYLYKTMKGNTTENISEHQPLTLINNTDAICTLVILISILTFTKTKIKLSDLFFVGGLCYLMFSSRRQFSMLVLIGSVVLGRLIVDMITRYSKND
jgi:FtsZ-binding cell division protein ZapB